MNDLGNEGQSVRTGFGPMTDRIVSGLIDGINIEDHKDKIYDKLVEPLTRMINQRMQPYIYYSAGLYLLVIFLLLIIIYILLYKKS